MNFGATGNRLKKRNIKGGLLITFEGGECAGKSTQAQMLADWLEEQGISVVLTREPGGTLLAEALRDHLLSEGEHAPGPRAEALLFAAARADHVAKASSVERALGLQRRELCRDPE